MAKKIQSSPPKVRKPRKATAAPLRSTSGAGYEFEDLIGAWLHVKMLAGEPTPGIGGQLVCLQAQTSALGWHVDDLLVTAALAAGTARLAISAKGNPQVNSAGLPADFVKRAWQQWRTAGGPMNALSDGLALVTRGTNADFDAAWAEIKSACLGSDKALALARIRSNPKQLKVFESVTKPDGKITLGTDEEAVELIRQLHVLPVDLQLAYSELESQAIAQCRRLLASGLLSDAELLWKRLIDEAKHVRLRKGTLTLEELLAIVRKDFLLLLHPDFVEDWKTLSNLTADYKERIQTAFVSGQSVSREAESVALEATIIRSKVTVVVGDSGTESLR